MAINQYGLLTQDEPTQLPGISAPAGLAQQMQPQATPVESGGGMFDGLANMSPQAMAAMMAGLSMIGSNKRIGPALAQATPAALGAMQMQSKLLSEKEQKSEQEKRRKALSQFLGSPGIAGQMGANWDELRTEAPELAWEVLQSKTGRGNGTAAMQNYEYWEKLKAADAQDGGKRAEQFQENYLRQRNDQLHGSLFFGRDKDGNVQLLGTTKSGQVIQPEIPEGTQLLGPLEKAAETKEGTLIGENRAGLPGSIIEAERNLKVIDDFLADPKSGLASGIEAVTADIFGEKAAAAIHGADVLDARARAEQLEGIAFKQAFETLKGGGQITEFESQSAAKALFRAKNAVTDAQFREAVQDFREAVSTGIAKLKANARDTGQQQNNAPVAGQQSAPAQNSSDPLGIR